MQEAYRVADRPLTVYHRFFIRDPGGNGIEIAEFTQHKTDS
ncbi:hypothetical protein [Nostoc sp. CHAB 5715]|nr:hypothetical protein [Nostoc sp. CHAB 5715]